MINKTLWLELNRKGFSLAEILMAIVLVVVALLFLSTVMISGLEAITKGSAYTEASTIAQSRMEKILYAVSEDYTAIDNASHPLRQPETIGDYTLTVTLTNGTAYGKGYKKVVVVVQNIDTKNRRKGAKVRLETIFIDKKN